MSVAPAVRPRSAIRRWVRRVLILAVIGVIVVGSFVGRHVYRRFTEARLLRETIADLDTRHPRWRLADLEADRAVVPDEENSAFVIRAAAARIGPYMRPVPGEGAGTPPMPPSSEAALTDEQLRSV